MWTLKLFPKKDANNADFVYYVNMPTTFFFFTIDLQRFGKKKDSMLNSVKRIPTADVFCDHTLMFALERGN